MHTLSREPEQIRAGDTLKWTRSLCDFPATAGWTLTYHFVSALSKFDIAATACGDDYAVNAAADATSAYAPGVYRWIARVSGNSEVHTVGEGTVTVLPNVTSEEGARDPRSQNERILDAINALIEGRANADVQRYTIHGRELEKMAIKDLMWWRGQYVELVNAEKAARGERVVVRIVKPVFRGRS